MKGTTVNRMLTLAGLGGLLAAATITLAPQAQAQPDPYWPVPPVWCPGGGTMTSWGGFCDGIAYPDNTKWHMDAFYAPFVGRVYNPIVCVIADAPSPPPLAPASGCGRGGPVVAR